MTNPPPIPTSRRKRRATPFVIAAGAVILIVIITGVVLGVRFVSQYGLTEPIDRKFGDQNLKSTVALVELHKVRFGRYPTSLKELKYTGDWDQLYLSGVKYYPSEDRQSYYVEVVRGWIGKPTLVMPDEFWQGTGYDKNLKPKEE